MALDDVGMIDVTEDLDLAADLETDGVVVVSEDHLESEETTSGAVDDLVDRAASTTPDSVDSVKLREGDDTLIAVVAALAVAAG